jgi:N-acetylmuramoyl-L-alanine amidase
MRKFLLSFLPGLLSLALIGCASPPTLIKNNGYAVDSSHSTQNQNERIRFLILHYTAADDERSLYLLTKGSNSTHYLLPSQPEEFNGVPIVLRLVPEEKRAWHAGVSQWHRRSNLNDSAIGVEIVNLGFTEDEEKNRTWYSFNEEQISALIPLLKDLIEKYQISPQDILGHSDIAPTRKYDPGKLFPWQRLAESGIGAWPDESTINKYLAGRPHDAPGDIIEIQRALNQYGYDQMPLSGKMDTDSKKIISAFQMHFRPSDISGRPDAQTEAIAKALLEKYRGPAS